MKKILLLTTTFVGIGVLLGLFFNCHHVNKNTINTDPNNVKTREITYNVINQTAFEMMVIFERNQDSLAFTDKKNKKPDSFIIQGLEKKTFFKDEILKNDSIIPLFIPTFVFEEVPHSFPKGSTTKVRYYQSEENNSQTSLTWVLSLESSDEWLEYFGDEDE